MSDRDIFTKVIPNFSKARQERNKIRDQYRFCLKSIERGDDFVIPSSKDYEIEYLGNKSEKKRAEVMNLIKKHGGEDRYSYHVQSNEEEIKEELEKLIDSITNRNRISIIVQIVFTIFLILMLSIAIAIGLLGIDSIVALL